jgi:hypothetical protein
MSDLTPPIVIDGDGFFDVYSTVGDACSWLEAVDVVASTKRSTARDIPYACSPSDDS